MFNRIERYFLNKARNKFLQEQIQMQELQASVVIKNNYISAGLDAYTGYTGDEKTQPDVNFRSLNSYTTNDLISLHWFQLGRIYKDISILQRALHIPVDYALKDGFVIEADGLSPDEIKEVENELHEVNEYHGSSNMEQIKKLHILIKYYGGGYLILEDGQDLNQEFRFSPDNKIFVSATNIWDMGGTKGYFKEREQSKGEAKKYSTDFVNTNSDFYYLGQLVDKTRVKKFKQTYLIDYYTRITRGWGLSIMESLKTPLIQMLMLRRLKTELVADGKIDVIKKHGLQESLLTGAEGYENYLNFLKKFSKEKNAFSVLGLDSQDDFSYKQINYGGLDHLSESAENAFASAVGMSRALLLGETQTGLGGDQGGTNNDIMLIMSTQQELKRHISYVVKLIIKNKFDKEPQNININFDNVEPITELEQAQRDSIITQTVSSNLMNGIITTEEAREMLQRKKVLEGLDL